MSSWALRHSARKPILGWHRIDQTQAHTLARALAASDLHMALRGISSTASKYIWKPERSLRAQALGLTQQER